ncbi:Cof-type HAD-IIB family hydrolase [Sphingomonas sp.]|uniref:Cof-type HAD-IIB family hydrolase n=1 Tax=Sphingomonas sp. TaxID=28214 RepID=UPI0035C7AE65
MTLVVCDVDGTLVDKQKNLADETVAAVQRLRDAGVGFTIISARPMSGMRWIADRLDLDVPMGAFNGGLVFRRDGSIATRATVPAAVARGVVAMGQAAPVDIWVFADDQWHATSGEGKHADSERRSANQEPAICERFDHLLDRADKITFVSDEPEVLAALRDKALGAFEGQATIVQSQTYYLDVTARAANKGDGIAALAQAIGADLSDTIAIGDQANDIAMFERAGRAIAMGNATDAVKAKAGETTESNDAAGVAHAIDTLILGRHT